jgi:hypothetical protein
MSIADDPITRFLDLRMLWGGGEVADTVQLFQWNGTASIGETDYSDHSKYVPLAPQDFLTYICGKDVLIATHGFNNNREQGIQSLSEWKKLLTVPDSAAFLGLLWPGDSESLHALCYPVEPAQAMDTGTKVAAFADTNFKSVASISFASHSLGARVILQTMTQMQLKTRRAMIMAGAVDDYCLTGEFSTIQQQAQQITALASKEDEVLRWAFPIGDFIAEIIDHDSPWWESALGRFGPAKRPDHFLAPCEIPDDFKYGHGSYLQTNPPAPSKIDPPAPPVMPPPAMPLPLGGVDGWQEAYSASVISAWFK